jgi:putative aminopeptidase FrvX
VLEYLKELTELNGVSGDEARVREYIKKRVKKHATHIFEDAYGNLIIRKGPEKGLKIMLAAHMDEVGLMITGIKKSGLLKFHAIGMMPNILMAKRVFIGKKRVLGVVGHKPIHLAKDEELKKMPKTKDLFIDIGVKSKKDANKMVQVGDYASFGTEFRDIGDSVQGKALDNRVGCFILLNMILEFDQPAYYAFTVQEEVGLRGARIAASRVEPHVAIAVDTTSSGEWPDERDTPKYPILGKGAVVTTADRSVICDENLVNTIRETAEQEKIPYQDKRPMIGGTDAGSMHVAGAGARSAVVSVPARYIHSPLAFASKGDISAAEKLLRCTMNKIIGKEKEWI